MSGHERIRAERARQIEQEGYTSDHDARQSVNDLVSAAACYGGCTDSDGAAPHRWPWRPEDWKPKDRLRNLERAGALYLAAAQRAEADGESGRRQRMLADGIAAHVDRIVASEARAELMALAMAILPETIARLRTGESTRNEAQMAAAGIEAAQRLLRPARDHEQLTRTSFTNDIAMGGAPGDADPSPMTPAGAA